MTFYSLKQLSTNAQWSEIPKRWPKVENVINLNWKSGLGGFRRRWLQIRSQDLEKQKWRMRYGEKSFQKPITFEWKSGLGDFRGRWLRNRSQNLEKQNGGWDTAKKVFKNVLHSSESLDSGVSDNASLSDSTPSETCSIDSRYCDAFDGLPCVISLITFEACKFPEARRPICTA